MLHNLFSANMQMFYLVVSQSALIEEQIAKKNFFLRLRRAGRFALEVKHPKQSVSP